ncbi:hypothetical protein COCC4DRAFT_36411 [Bipolaris maydis ATCC 48331]|uniref:Uncharacterized protein n=1 Tax=Cochliobolus heterostrophus (strain C4 / ATCC 48331 / race T) TaxID=665024 RepID=N4XEB1_COCH4|nr:uncharacterized protein COCC4DRAFT_36411 [Bipolaris maydis ATCC 48331]ENI10055.1 hypothetical protein COCC4DRAFT_36411 [Bipolaris maydis ATCC 48331]KAJ5025559.1 hypothetical protein J3E73DRAFT_413672 [Bipolaris maydis]KAJ6269774.1 hypothetical protein PSV08DRAFT_392628 [Bipolaris maydis]KAJ6280416.1 hypothetical protein J3E71DRAFT_382947 [Bipolaris maydis]
MADHIWDQPPRLTTAPIFDDQVYLAEALGLPAHQTEDDLDAELVVLARDAGIQDPYRFMPSPATVSRAMSTMTLDSDQTSSRSMHSQETQSTGFTSAPSRTSRDHVYSTDHVSAKRMPPVLVQASQLADNCQQPIERAEPAARPSLSSGTATSSSVTSKASSSQHEHTRKKRGSALFSLLRKEARYFATTGLHSRNVTTHAHSCPSALHRKAPAKSMSADELGLLAGVDTKASAVSLDAPSPPHEGPQISKTSSSESSMTARHVDQEPTSTDSALALEAFKTFRVQQKEQWDRVSTFESIQRKALAAHYRCELERLQVNYEARKKERMKQHLDDVDRLEERQVLAEHDLLETQAQETQNVATALKYIEAYCLGTNTSQEQTHTVTEDDFKKLHHQKMLQQGLPRKHTSAINVLRARQEVDFKRRLETQEAELRQLDLDLKKEESAKEAEYKKDVEHLESLIEARRRRLQQRWELRFEMWRLDWQNQHKMTIVHKLEHEEWPQRAREGDEGEDDVSAIPDASALAQFAKVAA